jgi:hypothetical protein
VTNFNIWLIWAITFLLFSLAAEGARRLGLIRRSQGGEAEGQVGATLGGLLGLLGLLIAFTFGMASARYDLRRSLQVETANALGTAYLRTDLIPESLRGVARELLRGCVDQQIEAASFSGSAEEMNRRQQDLHDKLWALAVEATRESPTLITSLFLQAVNQVIDSSARRTQLGWRNPLPPSILVTLYLVSLLVLSVMGFENGFAGGGRPIATTVIVLTLATVVMLIDDLNRPQHGLLRDSQQTMLDLRESMARSPSGP